VSQFPQDAGTEIAGLPAAPRRSLRAAVGLGIILLAVGVTLSLRASASARREPVAPFAYGLNLFVPVRGESAGPAPEKSAADAEPAPAEQPSAGAAAAPSEAAEAADPAGVPALAPKAGEAAEGAGPRTIEVQAAYKPLGADERSAVAEAFGGLDADGPIYVRWTNVVVWAPGDAFSPPRACALAVISDADADRWLDPLVPPDARGAGAYLGVAEGLEEMLAGTRFADAVEGVTTARLPAEAAVLEWMVLVRPAAAEGLGLAGADAEPNVAILALRRPGTLEEAMRRLWPLWQSRGLWIHPVDLRLARGAGARWVGLAGLAAMLAGGALLVGAAVRRLAARAQNGKPFGDLLIGAAQLAAGRPGRHALASVLVVAAMAAGAAAGWPAAGLVPGAEGGAATGLGMVGLSAAPVPMATVVMLLVRQAAARFLGLGLLMGLPALVPGVGWLVLLGEQAVGGMALDPATLGLLDRLPLRAGVAALEVQAAALLLVGAAEVWLGVVRPAALGCASRRAGYVEGVRRLCRLLVLALVISGAAAVVETLFIAAVSHSF
jgi:hypothetical protein